MTSLTEYSEFPDDYYNPKRKHDISIMDFVQCFYIAENDLESLPKYLQDILYDLWDEADKGKWLELDEAICIINEASVAWIRIGVIAQIVKEKKRYEGKFKSFTDFCQKGLNRSRSYIDRIIKASKTVIELACMGFKQLPTNESQARLLTKYQGDELWEKWREVLTTIPGHRINAKSIEETIDPKDENAYQATKITGTAWDNFKKKALASGLDPEEELEKFLGTWQPKEETPLEEVLEDEEIEVITPDKINAWLDDLENLCALYDLEQLQRLYNSE